MKRVDVTVVPSTMVAGQLTLRDADGHTVRSAITRKFAVGERAALVNRDDLERMERAFALVQKFLHFRATDSEIDELVEMADGEQGQTAAQLRSGAP